MTQTVATATTPTQELPVIIRCDACQEHRPRPELVTLIVDVSSRHHRYDTAMTYACHDFRRCMQSSRVNGVGLYRP